MNQMQSNWYESNLALLQKNHPETYNFLSESQPEPAGEIFFAPNGKPNLRFINKEGELVNMHAQSDPETEIPQFLDMVPEDSTGFVALIGMGLGYTPTALLSERKGIRHLAIFDLKPGIFIQALHHMDLSLLLSDPRVLLCINPEPDVDAMLARASRALQIEAIHTLTHLPSFSVDHAAYQKLSDRVFACVNDYNVGGGTIFAFGNTFLENRLSHLTSMHHHYLLEHLNGAFSGVPAILVAGGPSLDKNIHLLTQAREKAVIIAVDTVLPALLSHGITPNFLTSIDPEEFTYEKFAGVIPEIRHTSLICTAWVTPKVPKNFPDGRVFWTFAANRIESWMNSMFGGKILTAGAKTVAHLNFTSALLLGCSPIILIGQDLAFSGSKDHASQTVLSNQNMLDDLLKNEKDLVWVDGNDGNKVPTNRAFHTMIHSFERMFASVQENIINATEGGAYLKGTTVMPLQEALDTYCTKSYDISEKIDAFFDNSVPLNAKLLLKEANGTLKKIKALRKIIARADKLSRKAKKQLRLSEKSGTPYRSFSVVPQHLQQLLVDIDTCHQELDSEYAIWQLLEEVTMEGLRQSERMKHVIDQLQDNPDKYMEWLFKNFERLEAINEIRKKVLNVFEKHLTRIATFHKKEKQFGKPDRPSPDAAGHLIDTLELYFESGDVVLAQQTIDQLPDEYQDQPEIMLYKGYIAAHRTEYQKAEQYFQHAVESAPRLKEKIQAYRTRMGDTYLAYANRLKVDGYDIKKMLFKGLRYSKDHEGLGQEITALADADLKIIIAGSDGTINAEAKKLIRAWHADMEAHETLAGILPPETAAAFYRYYGNLMVAENKYQDAEKSFGRALGFSPDTVNLHIFLTDVLFAQNKFDQGIQHLQNAVKLDRSYATFWENIGDNLFQAGQADDAILAYEQCYLSLPEKHDLLFKIGNCYQSMGNLAAARETYQQLKNRISRPQPCREVRA